MDFNSLSFYRFCDDRNPLKEISGSKQKNYIEKYLHGLGCESVVKEEYYYDRDYLDEFSSFYSRSSQRYPNYCSRLHFFKCSDVNRATLSDALSGSEGEAHLQDNYLGFVVVRPISVAPFGRTVLALYPDQEGQPRRITTPARVYVCNIAGIELKITGLAWQQQDSAVAACATVCLWSMLHSSAYDEQHAVPTTAVITENASLFGKRPFPSTGLRLEQITEAIHKQNLNSVISEGDIVLTSGGRGFSKDRLSSNLGALIRSGYPVMILGLYSGGDAGHAICAVGFKEVGGLAVDGAGQDDGLYMADKDVNYIYIHDDNFGPNLKFEIFEKDEVAVLRSVAPDASEDCVKTIFTPFSLVAAVHSDVRITADSLYQKSIYAAGFVRYIVEDLYAQNKAPLPALSYSPRFMSVREYFKDELGKVVQSNTLSKARISIYEGMPPLSLHLGVLRIGMSNRPIVDILYDTTDSGRYMPAFGMVIYDEVLYEIFKAFPEESLMSINMPTNIVGVFDELDL